MVLKTIKNGNIITEKFSGKFDFETDLLVAGLGTAGAVCFYNAVKAGIKCIGIEKQSILGGTATAACVQDYYYGQLTGSLEKINKTGLSMMLMISSTCPLNTLNGSMYSF